MGVEDLNGGIDEREDANLNDVDDENVDLEDEDLDLFDNEDVDDEDVDDEAEDIEDDKDSDDDASNDDFKFDEKQTKEVNRIVKSRLERQEAKFLKDLREAAGVEFEIAEAPRAARLWGLLKSNPELSDVINQVIDQHLREGKATAPEVKNKLPKETALERKEAILDLKLADRTFNKFSDKILDWAENEGFTVVDAKSLKLAFMAWQGSQGKVLEATKKLNEQKRQATKKTVQKRASVQSSKSSGKARGRADYSKMNDVDILSSEGLSLYVED